MDKKIKVDTRIPYGIPKTDESRIQSNGRIA